MSIPTMYNKNKTYAGYNTSSTVYLIAYVNDNAYPKTLAVNTQPSTGYGGAKVSITKSDLTVVASKVFPYYQSVSDLTVGVPSGTLRRIYVEPGTAGQTIVGNLGYESY